MAQIRDPIHGSIEVTADETALIDAPFYQRLRNVMQLGFTVLAFPGGTHTRYSHGVGAMQVASRCFDALPTNLLPPEDRARFRQALRIAVLTHDIGHAPLSHASEAIMCPRGKLGLPAWTGGPNENERRANHEDYTLKILLDSEFARTIEQKFGEKGISPESVAGLITGRHAPGHESDFMSGTTDWAPLLRQLVSSELDADRMDYLQRDSFYTGVSYGRYDLDWLATNLTVVERDGAAYLALAKRAIFAFEDFLLSRYHMFVSVYYHYTPICFDNMLTRYYAEAPGEYEIPTDIEKYLDHDDVALTARLRESRNRWAQAIVRRRPWRMVAEINEMDRGYDIAALNKALAAEKIEAFETESKGILSKYFGKKDGPRLYVHDPGTGRYTPVEEYTPLYERYANTLRINRIYVDPDRYDAARSIVRKATGADLAS
ncbi:MAG TPA: HD domain-containing protein [bacterium]|nr:HD domain-containing protein [bacterium]